MRESWIRIRPEYIPATKWSPSLAKSIVTEALKANGASGKQVIVTLAECCICRIILELDMLSCRFLSLVFTFCLDKPECRSAYMWVSQNMRFVESGLGLWNRCISVPARPKEQENRVIFHTVPPRLVGDGGLGA